MLYLKSCPRCHGDIHLDSDRFGKYAKCLQCGFTRDFPANWNPPHPGSEQVLAEPGAEPSSPEEEKAA